MYVCYEGREVTAGNLALQGESEEMEPRSLQALLHYDPHVPC